MKEKSNNEAIQASIERLFSVPKITEPNEGAARQEYAASASATFQSKPFRVLVTEMRDELMRMAVSHDRDTPNGDMVRGGVYALDQLWQRYEMLDGEHRNDMAEKTNQ